MTRLTLILLVAASPVFGDVTYPSGKKVECYCTDSVGARVEMGETICLTVGGRMFTAQCQMSLNNPMWREISEGCVSSGLRPAPGSPLPQTRQPSL